MAASSNTIAHLVSCGMAFGLVACVGGSDSGEPVDVGPTFPSYVPSFATVAGPADGVDQPQDLDFHPGAARAGELWVLNKGTEDSGGEVVIIDDATVDGSDVEVRQDANAWHFMSLPSALAFSEDTKNFATSPEVTDANHSGGTFTGPTLWSSDLDVFAMPSGGNGSHLDMLHQSPNSMGIAHEVDDVYWVFDGYSDELVRYDFQSDHGPGNDDHSDAKVARYPNVPIQRVSETPSHLVLDKATDWLYVADTKKGRILRLDVTSGVKDTDLQPQNESLAEYELMKDEVWEVFAEGLDQPCGIDVAGGWLYVTDNGTGEIIAYELVTGAEIGRIQTDAKSIMGIKVGPDGLLYYVDRQADRVIRIEQG
jgi:hypothetical protein